MKRTIRNLLLVAVVIAMAIVLRRTSDQFDWRKLFSQPGLLFVFLSVYLYGIVVQFWVWYRLLNRNGRLIGVHDGYGLFALSSLSRYLPAGKILQVVSFAHFASEPLIKVESVVSLVVSLLCALLPGAFIVLCSARAMVPKMPGWAPAVGVALLIGGLGLISRLEAGRWFFRLARRKFTDLPESARISGMNILEAIFSHSTVWLMECLGLLALLWVVNPSYAWTTVTYIGGSLAIASVAGYFAFVVPAGLGVRESLFVILLAQRLSLFESTFVSLGSRLGAVIADVLFSLPLIIQYVGQYTREKKQPQVG